MKGLVTITLAAALLAACSKGDKGGPTTYVLEDQGHWALAVKGPSKIEVYPLPDNPQVIVDGEPQLLGPAGIIPRCPCDRPECREMCRPKGRPWWVIVPPVLDRAPPIDRTPPTLPPATPGTPPGGQPPAGQPPAGQPPPP
jgi:hypothetical protein